MNRKQLLKLIDKAVQECSGKAGFDSLKVAKFIKFFKNLPLNEAVVALEAFAKGLKRKSVEQTLFIYSPVSLSASELTKFKNYFKKSHPVSETRLILDPSLLGGVMFKIGDTVYDNSVRSKISQVAEVIRA